MLLPVGGRQPIVSDARRPVAPVDPRPEHRPGSGRQRGDPAASHPMANIDTNLIGAFDRLILEERHDRLEPSDILLLCSDGLSGALRDAEMAHIMAGSEVAATADRLIERALAQGARDNVSAVV